MAVGMLAGGAGAEPVGMTSTFEVSLYGYLKLDASYDTARTVAGNLMYYVLPEAPEGSREEFNMTARETRIGLDLRVPEIDGLRIFGRIETDFYGGGAENSANLRMRLAFVDIERDGWALRAGQDWETFINTLPRTVNFSYLADAGALGLRRPQVRLSRVSPVGDNSRLITRVAAARTIGQDIDGGGQDDGAAAGYPSVQASVALETPGLARRLAMVALSGHYGTETVSPYTDPDGTDGPVDVPETDYESWSVIASVMFPLTESLLLQGSFWQGANLDNYFGGIGQGINRQQQKVIGARGGWAQLMVDISPQVNLNLGYGLDNPDSADLNPGDRAQNELWFANVFYHINKAAVLALEYSHLSTDYRDGETAVNNRVQGSVIFRF